jgi:hypothetical protein
MPELLDDFGDPDRSKRAGWLARIAHLLPVVVIAELVFSALSWFEVIRAEEWPWWARAATSMTFLLAIFAAIFHHQMARLCLRCMEAVPADAAVRAQSRRKHASLWMYHQCVRLRGLLPLLIISAYNLALAGVWALIQQKPADLTWTLAPVDLFAIGLVWSFWVHHRYRPWCPYCKPWDDGGGIREPSPDPTGSGTKVSS